MKTSGRLTSTLPSVVSAGLPALGLLLAFGCLALALFLFTASPAGAFLFATATPTQENLWSQGILPKPTHTSVAIIQPTDTPVPSPTLPAPPAFTGTPASFTMEIVENPSVPVPQPDQLQASAPVINTNGKYILVDISEQHLYAYENNSLVFSFVASTGINNATRVGTFAVQTKLDNAYGATWNIWMPNWLGIYYSGSLENGIHALPILPNGATLWEGFLGRPVSYGCVVLATYESKLLYDWAEMGTAVEIQW
jgi:lipoprotein-anchoring transpeptidase ErfK/SrfK